MDSASGVMSLVVSVLWPLLLVGAILYGIFQRRRRAGPITGDWSWYLRFALSREDLAAQLLLLLSVCFLGVTLLALNKDFGTPLSERSVLLLTSVVAVACGYAFRRAYTVGLGLVGLASWWSLQGSEWARQANVKTAPVTAGVALIALLLYAVGRAHETDARYKRLVLVYTGLAMISILGFLFGFSTSGGLEMLQQMTKGGSLFASWKLGVALLLLLAGTAGAVAYGWGKGRLRGAEAAAVLLLLALFVVLAILPEQQLFQPGGTPRPLSERALSSTGVLWAVVFNLLIFLALLGVVFSGYLRREEWLINTGAIFLFILIFTKYSDWFFTFLDKSVFFITAGILLFGLGWLMEKGRRLMISSVKREP